MVQTRKILLGLVVSIAAFTAAVSVATAQSPDSGASTPKQMQRAQRKAERKAARTKKNAELSTLEKNGYQPNGDQLNYPQNLQSAEKKAGSAVPASAP